MEKGEKFYSTRMGKFFKELLEEKILWEDLDDYELGLKVMEGLFRIYDDKPLAEGAVYSVQTEKFFKDITGRETINDKDLETLNRVLATLERHRFLMRTSKRWVKVPLLTVWTHEFTDTGRWVAFDIAFGVVFTAAWKYCELVKEDLKITDEFYDNAWNRHCDQMMDFVKKEWEENR